MNGFVASPIIPERARPALLRLAGIRVGRGATIRHRVQFTGKQISLGDRVYIQHGVVLHSLGPLRIGNDVALAPNVVITNVGHDYTDPARRQGAPTSAPTTIGDGAWLGLAAVLSTAVAVGEGAVIGAGALVTKDVPAHAVVVGVPARIVRELS